MAGGRGYNANDSPSAMAAQSTTITDNAMRTTHHTRFRQEVSPTTTDDADGLHGTGSK